MRKNVLILSLTFFFFSCAPKYNTFIAPEFKTYPYRTVAVLLFDNESLDLTAETMLRDMIIKRLKNRGFNVIDKKHVDNILKEEFGITDGGQLPSVEKKDIAEKLNADILCYGYIHDFTFQNLGFVIKKKVVLEISLYDKEGKLLFNTTGEGNDTKIYTNSKEAKKAFLRGTAEKIITNIADKPLYRESQIAVDKIFSKMP